MKTTFAEKLVRIFFVFAFALGTAWTPGAMVKADAIQRVSAGDQDMAGTLSGNRRMPVEVPQSAAFTTCADVTEIPQVECEALLALYNSTNGPGWTNSTNWLQTDTPCSWYGIYCGGGHVSTIYFDSNNLTGSIPPEIGNLPELYTIVLTSNQLSGSIPPEIGNLSNLQTLRLWHNHLTGSLPVEMGNLSNLQYFWLDDNEVGGAIPEVFGDLTGLRVLALDDNQFSGSLPPSLGNLVNLQYLNLATNQFTGSIPSSFGNLTNLIELWLFETQVSGTIPTEIGNLTALTKLGLHNNQLTGTIPAEIGNLINLTHLSLANNQMSGEIPASITNLVNLTHITICCGLTTSDPAVIAFLDANVPGWQQCSGPHIKVNLHPRRIYAMDWALGTNITLTIDDVSNGPGVDYSDSGVVSSVNASGSTRLGFDLEDFPLELNDLIVISGNSITKELVFVPINITNIDLEQDRLSGTTEPGVELSVLATDDAGGEGLRKVTADGAGNWPVDFSAAGSLPGEDLIVDIIVDTEITVIYREPDNDYIELFEDVHAPGITFDPNSNSVYSEIFSPVWPLGTEVTVTIDDASNGPGIDFSDSSPVVPSGDPDYNLVEFEPASFPVEPPDLITMSARSIIKEFVMVPLSITDIDLEQDVVSGTALGCNRLTAYASNSQGEWGQRRITADETGKWTADFSTAGPTPDEELIVDITWGSHVDVDCGNGDGDYIELGRIVPNPMFGARPGEDHVEGGDWPLGTTVTVQIDDPNTPENPDYTGNAIVRIPEWNPNETRFDLDFRGVYDLKVGDIITVTDGNVTKELVVTNFAIQNVDLDTDTVSGTSQPNQVVSIWTCFTGPCINREEQADQDGNWTTNFSTPGDQDWEQDTADIRPGSWVDSAVWDQDGDGTMSGWSVPEPHFDVRYQDGWIEAYGWPLGTQLTLEIEDPATSASPDFATTTNVDVIPWDPSETLGEVHLNGAFEIQPGMTLTVSGASLTKELVISDLTLTAIDPETDIITGSAEPNANLWINNFDATGMCCRNLQADSNGVWSVDYSQPGPDGEPVENLIPGSSGTINASDEDGDNTTLRWRVPVSRISARMVENDVQGYDWPLGASVTLTIDDPATIQPVDHQDTQTVVIDDSAWEPDQTVVMFPLTEHGFNLQPGQVITMTDGITTKTHTVTTLAVTAVDPVLDTVSGTAEPGSNIEVSFWGLRRATADVNGNWTTDFAHPGQESDEQDINDIAPGSQSWVDQFDEDRDSTNVHWRVPNPTFAIRTNEDAMDGWEWPLGSTVMIEIDDPATLTNPDYTDTATVGVADWDPNQTWFHLNFQDFDFKAGEIVTVTDGNVTKQLTITNFMITNVNAATDQVSGIAAPGQRVDVWTCWYDQPCANRAETADENGNWTTNFAVPGEEDWEQTTNDLRPGSWIDSAANDEDGDSLMFNWNVPSPRIDAHPMNDEVETYDWPLGASLTLTIDDPGTTQNPDYTATGIAESASNPYIQSYFDFSFVGTYDLKAGDVVTVTDGISTQQHVVSSLVLTSIDPVTNMVSGTAEPDSLVEIQACDAAFNCGNSREESAGQDSSWSTDFGSIDLQPGMWVEAGQRDINGNRTMSSSPVYASPVSDSDGDGQLDPGDPCPADPTNTCNTEGSATGILGSEGGTLVTENGKASLTVPTGALPDWVTLSITDMGSGYEISVFEGIMLVVHSYTILPHGTQFNPAATITFGWDDADDNGIVDGTSLHETHLLLIKDGLVITPACAVNPSCNMTANRLTLEVNSLSLFALAAPANQPPRAEAGPDRIVSEGETVTLDASASSDPEAGPLTYEWDLDNDGEYDDAAGVTTRVSYPDNGSFTIGLRVSDVAGSIDFDTVVITVNNMPPEITSLHLRHLIKVGVKLNATAKFNDPGTVDTFTAIWNWGDGTKSQGVVKSHHATGSHVYTRPGIYIVTVTITDKDGGVDRSFDVVIVLPRR